MVAILLLESRAEELRALLSTKASGLDYYFPDDGEDAIARCDIWLGEPDRAVSLLTAGYRPAWLQSTWAGFKPLLAEHLPQGYRLSRAVGVFGQPIAQYILAHLLAHEQRLFALQSQQQQQVWDDKLSGFLSGKTLLIVGAGDIGTEVAAILSVFGVTLHGIVNTPRALPGFEHVAGIDALAQEVAQADYVISLLPDTDKTQNLYSTELFARMKLSVVFINVGRGTSVIDKDLIAALKAGKLARAVLDVFRQEPLPAEHPFWLTPNLTLTPHIAGLMVPALMADLFLDNLQRYSQGDSLRGEVDFSREY
ncbi:MAG: D-2-hydroxyacid dehydrogenase [Candidatus Malihini olakiniferum]